MGFPRLVIAGTHSGVGKTTVTLALLAAFRAQGRRVQPFKIGPDFIDPGHHQLASGRESHNLDGWMLETAQNRHMFQKAARDAELSIIEGMMGLFDGSSPTNEVGSTAEMAKLLKAPVLLVIDGSAMARSAAAMVFGYAEFDPDVTIAGVIFNRIKSEGHFRILQEAVEKEAKVPVVGFMRPDSELTIPDRHLGLRTALEGEGAGWYEKFVQGALKTLDLSHIEQLAHTSSEVEESLPLESPMLKESSRQPIKIGLAHDPAFCFYYSENLALLKQVGGDLVRFSPLHDTNLPSEVEVLYLGGGYPEMYAAALQENTGMRRSIAEFIQHGGVVYAECGGMLYLSRTLQDFEGEVYDMVGAFPADGVMTRSHMTLGYRELTLRQTGLLGEMGHRVRGHEFHYSHLDNLGEVSYLGTLSDARGADCGPDGLTVHNVVGLYTHLHFASHPRIPVMLLDMARKQRRRKVPGHE